MENHRKPPENNPPSKKGVEVMEQLVKERKEEKQMNKVSIVNANYDMANIGDFTRLQDVPKQIRISDYNYAFVQNENASGRFESIGLWVWSGEDWVEVTDLTGIYVFEYKAIHKYAVAIGWIDEDKDLFI